jgi:cytochrome b6-f complex iron-sulfur subunit
MLATACAKPQYVPFPTGATGDTGTVGGVDPTDGDPYPCEQVVEAGGAGWSALDLADYPELANVGGWVYYQGILVAHAYEGCYSAIASACAHEGVTIEYDPVLNRFKCPPPGHGAVYDLQGNKVAGPQPTGLPVYPCGRVGDVVWVKLG